MGFDLTSGNDIEKAMENLSGTSIAHLQPNRKIRKKSNINTIQGISDWSEWCWPVEGPEAGFICARPLPGFGKWKYITPI